MSCGAGASPAIFPISPDPKNAGGTPALRNNSRVRGGNTSLLNHFQWRSVEVHFGMRTMKMKSCIRAVALFVGCLILALPAHVAAQSTGRIEFTARVAPAGGRPEPVRQLTFYLLRKSLEDIRSEALRAEPVTEIDKFIDGLVVSPELKAWMKKHHSVRLSGEDFTKSLTPEDIVDIPEYFKAYMTHNEAYRGAGFPEAKFKDKDPNSNPERYKAQREEYKAAVRRFIAAAPDTVKGMDLELVDLNPYAKWASLEGKQRELVDTRAFQLAEERYLVAHTDTDLDGHGSFAGIAPGNYWIGMFGAEAISGDVRLHWDFPVTVRQGQTAQVELSNLNAVRPRIEAQNSSN